MLISIDLTDGVRRQDERKRGRPRVLMPFQDMAIAMARRDGIPWKVLMRFYCVSRSVLQDAQRRGEVIFRSYF